MTWESDFRTQWKTFLDIVQTRARREGGRFDVDIVNQIVEAEKAKWMNSSHFNGVWLRQLSQRHPALGEEFGSVLKAVRIAHLSQVPASATPPWVWSVVLIALGAEAAIGAAVLMRVFGAPEWQQIAAAGAMLIIIFPVLSHRWSTVRQTITNDAGVMVRRELDAAGSRLLDITREADLADRERDVAGAKLGGN